MKRGTEFYHMHYLNPDVPPANREPLHCVVTKVAHGGVYWRPKGGGSPMYFPHDQAHKYVKQVIKEDGGAGGGAVMAAGNGGFSSSAPAAGPVAGFDPILPLKKRIKKIIRAKPPGRPGEGLVGDNV